MPSQLRKSIKMNSFKLDFGSDTNDYVKAWMLDAVCNSCDKGDKAQTLKVADLLSEAREIQKSDQPNGEIAQTKLGRLATRIGQHEAQQKSFRSVGTAAQKAWCGITGKAAWKPYSNGNATPMDATATNAFFADRLG